ncbi:Heterogeneous nuclear ribonucleoprotein F [Thelohanellus kitauei]|uniref:Heterogeneous nuclear ribonucleoprotein F n=1 Tax=Thelohanellus kitauei TaxID=669202 RepID=A0A0C2MZL3_THEKT|nr:Heterogeneous nuclear ribonucleoprotein F [Thelohanellus kitauei]
MELSETRYYIRLRGLPWSATKSDIQEFLKDVRICEGDASILFTISEQGKRSGDAIVVIPTKDDFDKALSYNNKFIGKRYVEVTPCDAKEFEDSLLRTAPKDDEFVVRLRGLPYAMTEADIRNFFHGINIPSNNIVIIMDDQNRCSGDAYVEFLTAEDTQKAINKHRERMGSRFIEIFQSSRNEMAYVSNNRPTPLMSINTRQKRRVGEFGSTKSPRVERDFYPATGGYDNPTDSGFEKYIHARGLPFECSGRDIFNFFHPLSVTSVSLLFGENGKITGDADVFFESDYDALRALDYDKKRMGKRYVELFLRNRKLFTNYPKQNHGYVDSYKEPPIKRYPEEHPYPGSSAVYQMHPSGYEHSVPEVSSRFPTSELPDPVSPHTLAGRQATYLPGYLKKKLQSPGVSNTRDTRSADSYMRISANVTTKADDNFFPYY